LDSDHYITSLGSRDGFVWNEDVLVEQVGSVYHYERRRKRKMREGGYGYGVGTGAVDNEGVAVDEILLDGNN